MIVLISDAYSVSKIKECSDSYSTVFRCGRCAVGGVRIVKVIMYTYLFSYDNHLSKYPLISENGINSIIEGFPVTQFRLAFLITTNVRI